jgi:prepilin-type N-terminal cleavage/methylation domain-containing protein
MHHRRGFSLIEVMVALAILAFVAIGALGAIIMASQNVRDGQLRQYKAALVEARVQLLMLADKTQLNSGSPAANALYGTLGSYPGQSLEKVAIGSSPWQLDPTPASTNALGTGPFFSVTEGGNIATVSSGATSCADSTLKKGTLCREVALISGMPDGSSPTSGTAYTLWTRVIRVGDPSPSSNPSLYAVVDREVVVQ